MSTSSPAGHERDQPALNGVLITMLWIIVVALVAIVAVSVLGFALHLLFSPWLLVAIGILVFIHFRSRRSRR
jgi:hypothetical protein